MLKGLYAGASGMIANQLRLDVVANNLSKIQQTGFKKDRATMTSFSEMLHSEATRTADLAADGAYVPPERAPVVLGVECGGSYSVFSQGELQHTENPLDVALDGPGFFVVSDVNGNQYLTRDGAFTLDPAGTLITGSGHTVVDDAGIPITIRGQDVTILEDASVMVDGRSIARLKVVEAPGSSRLLKFRDGLFVLRDPGFEPQEAIETAVRQGYLERSNVNTVSEMVEMIQLSRLFETNQKVVRIYDTILARAINDLGKIG